MVWFISCNRKLKSYTVSYLKIDESYISYMCATHHLLVLQLYRATVSMAFMPSDSVSTSQVTVQQKGQQWSGGVINCNQISSYKDSPPVFKRHVSWRPVKLINQPPGPQKLAANIILLHDQVHPLSAHLISTLMPGGDECFITRCWRRKKTQNPHVFHSDLSVHLCSFFLYDHFTSFVLFVFRACTTGFLKRMTGLHMLQQRILQCQGNRPGLR